MAQPAIENRIKGLSQHVRKAMTRSQQYSTQGGWTSEEEQALRDTIDALSLLVEDSQAALELAQQDLTNCLNEQ